MINQINRLNAVTEKLYKPTYNPIPYWFNETYLTDFSKNIRDYFRFCLDGKFRSNIVTQDPFDVMSYDIDIYSLNTSHPRNFLGEINYNRILYAYEIFSDSKQRLISIIPSPVEKDFVGFCIYSLCRYDKDKNIKSAYLEQILYNHITNFPIDQVMIFSSQFLNYNTDFGEAINPAKILQ